MYKEIEKIEEKYGVVFINNTKHTIEDAETLAIEGQKFLNDNFVPNMKRAVIEGRFMLGINGIVAIN